MSNGISINVADGQVTEWHGSGSEFRVSLIDWKNEPLMLSFADVAAVLVMSPSGVDLSHLERSDDDPLLLATRDEEDCGSNGLVAFRFISAWDDKSVLTVIANSVTSDPA